MDDNTSPLKLSLKNIFQHRALCRRLKLNEDELHAIMLDLLIKHEEKLKEESSLVQRELF